MLGQLEVVDDGGSWSAPLGGMKQRAVLATLLLDAGRPVATNRVIESVWDDPPASAAHAVEVYVSKLRKAFAAHGNGGERIARRNGGYVALIGPEELDLSRFRALTRRAATASSSGDPATASRILAAALGLWRGEPLACIEGTPLAEHARDELEDERLAAVEALMDAELALGRHARVIDEMRRLVAVHPDREQLWFRLILALYRSGRQVEALETYARVRVRLLNRLGIQPSRQLRDLQRSILEQDPELEAPAGASSAHLATTGRTAVATVLDRRPV